MKFDRTDFMNAKECADYLQISLMTIYRLSLERKIPCSKVGGQWRYSISTINKWMEKSSLKLASKK